MVVNFSKINFNQRPTLKLQTAGDVTIGVLGYAKNIECELKYNELSTITFELPAFVDGKMTPGYQDVVGRRIIQLDNLMRFVLLNPTESGNGVSLQKVCTAKSLEYEFVDKRISLPKDTYKFWDALQPADTFLGMVMERMPSWTVGTVSQTLMNKYRTFEISSENLYNVLKGTAQTSYGCIFEFDTMTRTVHVRDTQESTIDKSLFLSTKNLIKDLDIEENTEDIVTRLDVNGAEGVDIRDVNPCGTNKLINLDYFMTPDNFEQNIIDAYYAWKETCDNNRQSFYSLSIQYSLKTAQLVAEQARLTDLRSEMTGLENVLAVAIQSVAMQLAQQSDVDDANANIQSKQNEIDQKQKEIESITAEKDNVLSQMRAITEACCFEAFFTEDEYKLVDRYLYDNELSESSFVASEIDSFMDEGDSAALLDTAFSCDQGAIEEIVDSAENRIFHIRGGTLISSDLEAQIISAIVEARTDQTLVITAHLANGTMGEADFPQGCLSITGNYNILSNNNGYFYLFITSGQRYFTLNASEYQKRSVAWELYEYGNEALRKLASPTYTFSLTSANFLAMEEFISFRDSLELGQSLYLRLFDDRVIHPIVIGVKFIYDDKSRLELLFSDSFASDESKFKLVDLLEQSVSMGKNVEMNKFLFAAFTDSGASTGIREFMTGALDTAKNAIFASSAQAISMDGAGLRLRKWANEERTAYEPEQIWMNNNSILMTADHWATAQMAIGKFSDTNLGECWGVVAPMIVGTLLAGESLVVESAKKDGGTAVFKMDADGCRMYNTLFSLQNDTTKILLNPDLGLVLGGLNAYSVDENGVYSIDEEDAKFWVDMDGNVHFRGELHGATGNFTGAVYATELHIGEMTAAEYIISNSSHVFNQAEMPTDGYHTGDLWRDSDSGYNHLYIAVGTEGAASDWMPVTTQAIKGAKLDIDTGTGTIQLLAANTISLTGGALSFTGAQAIDIASTGGVNITGGDVTVSGQMIKLLTNGTDVGTILLGGINNTITSDGILTLNGGSIILDGQSNIVTIGNNSGTVNIGKDGTGTINLATYQVQSSTETTAYNSSYATNQAASTASHEISINYSDIDEEGTANDAVFKITTEYMTATITNASSPEITDGKLLQFMYSTRGMNIYADTEDSDAAKVIVAPSIQNGHMLGWNVISGQTVCAANMSAGTICASHIYLDGVAVADQKWTLDTISAILNDSNVIPGIKNTANNALWKANHHYHIVTEGDDGSIVIGEVSAEAGNFNIADTRFYQSGVSAAITNALFTNSWSGGVCTVHVYSGTNLVRSHEAARLSLNIGEWDTGTLKCPVSITSGGGQYPSNTGYSASVDGTDIYNLGRQAISLSVGEWRGGSCTVSTMDGDTVVQSQSISIPNITITWYNDAQGYARVVASCGGVSVSSSKNITSFV